VAESHTPTQLKSTDAADPSEGNDMKRLFGYQPGGGILNVYQFDPQEFGSIGNNWIVDILDQMRATRRKSFKVIKSLLDAYKIMGKDEEVQHIALGTNKLGHRVLVVVTVLQGGPM
jgi:hypothetical protein